MRSNHFLNMLLMGTAFFVGSLYGDNTFAAGAVVVPSVTTKSALISADAFGDFLSNNFPGGFDPNRGYESDLLGGWKARADGSVIPRQLLIQTDPYGPYNTGCGLAVNTGSTYTQQNPVSEGNPWSGAPGVVNVGGFDTVANCTLYGNTRARLILDVKGYTPPATYTNSTGYSSVAQGQNRLHIGGPVVFDTAHYTYTATASYRDEHGNNIVVLQDVPVTSVSSQNGAWNVMFASGFTHTNQGGVITFSAKSNGHNPLIGDHAAVHLAAPLTEAQASQIHPNMYITTNSNSPLIAPGIGNGDGLPTRRLFAGYVSDAPKAGDTAIHVIEWDVPGGGTGANGQTPSTEAEMLDHDYSNYGKPVVFLGGGAAGSQFAHNWFAQIDGNQYGDQAGSLIHQITPLEIDLNVINPGSIKPHSIFYSGINMNAGNQPDRLTDASHELFLGGVIKHHLMLNGGPGNWDIDGDGVYVPVAGASGINPSTVGQTSQEWDQPVRGLNTMRTVLWDEFIGSSDPRNWGWKEAVVHFGTTVDGPAQVTGQPGGSKQADLEWNYAGQYGGLSICGYAHNCGLTVHGDGSTAITGQATFSQQTTFSGQTAFSNQANFSNQAIFSGQTIFNGTAFLSGGAGLGNGQNFIFWPRQKGVPAAMMQGTDPGTVLLTTNAGSPGHLEAGQITVSGDLQGTNGSNRVSGLHADGNGNWSTTVNTPGGGALAQASYVLAWLPTANETDGAHLWCSDCVVNHVQGAEVYWHAHAGLWTDSQNNTLTR
ncbi:hypothetical protein GS501_04995 [Saccharibacter sp. 17.LH.SD]|uniref:hypothetical protein n=1 Tax=Saccharibacter sp. 17.LH.SD TaxID=2689393 RepID=UPI00136BC7ED|nr:hypothetical protein [Saccharibacter sp. 17.LH.SD]MXV44404.1 hypothetical protein [Saccharibacter sp. 17.LH.SD]